MKNHDMNNPSLPHPNTAHPKRHHSLRKEDLASSGVGSETVRYRNITFPVEAADVRANHQTQSDGNYAAAKVRKEDDIGNKWGAMTNVIEKEEVIDKENDTKEDKIVSEVNKKLKLIKNDDKTIKKNKTINKKKHETPRPELKSIIKNKSKQKTAKPSDVNERKITKFLLPDKGETPKPKFTQKPAEKLAKQDFNQTGSLPDNRKVGGGKQAVIENYFLTGTITQPSKGIQGEL